MSSDDFPVGSIVYFLHNKTERVLPAQVVERIVRTSLDGSKSTYIIAVKASDKLKRIEVDPSKVDIFSTPDSMKDFMVSRATEAITKLIDTAVKASHIFTPIDQTEREREPVEDMILPDDAAWHTPAADRPLTNKNKKTEYAEVDLGDGRTARMKV